MQIRFGLLALLFLAEPLVSSAQTSDAEIEAEVNLLNVQKKEAIAKLVPVFGNDSTAFWKIYNEYQESTKANTMERIKLYEGTALSYQRMNAQVADSLATQYFKNRTDVEKTLEVYFNKVKTATNSVIAFEFYQGEIYLLTMIRAQIMQKIPTYGSLQPAPGK